MSYVEALATLPLEAWRRRAQTATVAEARRVLGKSRLDLADFAVLISPGAAACLETLCARSQATTRQRFGRAIRLFAPIYVSNQCVNNCRYCGFARRNAIVRTTLTVPEVGLEARELARRGFRSLLLVASEQPALVTPEYLAGCVRACQVYAPDISLEVAPSSTEAYRTIVEAGAEGLVVFQETYDREVYAEMHPSGPKRDFAWRVATPERAYAGGFRRLGLGALLGLDDWRREALALAAHVAHLYVHCWKAQVSVSLPRLRPAASGFVPRSPLSDRELTQLTAALRLTFPDLGLVLSTRESAHLRDGLIPLGITQISAGSHTEPGGYTGVGEKHPALPTTAAPASATGQFDVADERPAEEIVQRLRSLRLDPVWKDWDTALHSAPHLG
jgi:2-iminoacetate synthase